MPFAQEPDCGSENAMLSGRPSYVLGSLQLHMCQATLTKNFSFLPDSLPEIFRRLRLEGHLDRSNGSITSATGLHCQPLDKWEALQKQLCDGHPAPDHGQL